MRDAFRFCGVLRAELGSSAFLRLVSRMHALIRGVETLPADAGTVAMDAAGRSGSVRQRRCRRICSGVSSRGASRTAVALVFVATAAPGAALSTSCESLTSCAISFDFCAFNCGALETGADDVRRRLLRLGRTGASATFPHAARVGIDSSCLHRTSFPSRIRVTTGC
jgi:hypothetical protein